MIFTRTAGTPASSTSNVTKKKPWTLSPPGSLTSNSRFLCDINKPINKPTIFTAEYRGAGYGYVEKDTIKMKMYSLHDKWAATGNRHEKETGNIDTWIKFDSIKHYQMLTDLTPLDPSFSS